MTFRKLAIACLLGALACGGSAQAQYLLSPMLDADIGDVGQLQVGTGLPRSVGWAGSFLGGMTSVNGGTLNCLPPGMGCRPDGAGFTYWPSRLIYRNPSSMGSILQG